MKMKCENKRKIKLKCKSYKAVSRGHIAADRKYLSVKLNDEEKWICSKAIDTYIYAV